jgi:general secretion pathway protein D
MTVAFLVCTAILRADDGQKPETVPPPATLPAASRPAASQSATSQPASSAPATSGPAASGPAGEAAKPKLVPMSFNNASLADIAKFLNERLGKPVLVAKEVASIQVTLVNPKPLPEDEAMYVLTTALQDHGVAIEERDHTVHLIPIAQVAQGLIKTVGPEVDVNTLSPKNSIVRKVFKVRYYDATKLVDVLKPLLPSYGHITADPGSGKLMIVANVERLVLMAGIIEQLDVPGVTGGELRVFPIREVDVYELVPMLEKLIAGYLGVDVKAVSAVGGAPSGGGDRGERREGGPPQMMMGPSSDRPGGGGPSPAGAGAVMVKAEKTPVLLIPDARQSCIVVAAPTNVLDQIGVWLTTLDQPKPPRTQTEIIEARYSDASDLASQLTSLMNNMPDDSLRNALRICPFPSSRRIMLVGSEQNRKIVKDWIAELDVADTGTRVTKTWMLKNADAQQVADNIKELFGDQQQRSYFWWGSDRGGRGGEDRTKVTVTANVRSNSVTVVAAPEKMKRIEEQIEELDAPFHGVEAAPRVFNLRFADPEKTRELLENLFTKKEGPSMPPWWYDEMPNSTPTPVGRLFGQFRFEAYPESGKLIVVSKNEENYKVIEDLLAEIDRPQSAGIPRIVQLKFANAETVAEQLNALLNAPGTPASILRQGIMDSDLKNETSLTYNTQDGQNNQNQKNQQQRDQQQQSTSMMQFWWQNAQQDLVKSRQASNLVGKLRIVPNVEQNLLMVAAPDAYADAIEEFVRELDKPGQQVLVKAVIAEVALEDATSLGFRFSSDSSVFETGDPLISEDALKGLLTYDYKDNYGQAHSLSFNLPVYNLLNLLKRLTDLKIRSEPKVFTSDNQKAMFFDGQDVPFIDGSQTNSDGNSLVQSFAYRPVGIKLAVRPHITKERTVDLQVNLEISSYQSGNTLFGGVIIDRKETDTRVVLEDGKTFLISGILQQKDQVINRGIPGLCDIPGLGEVFKHHEVVKVNTELLIFLTPYVIGPELPKAPIEADPLQRLQQHFPDPITFGTPAQEPATQPAETKE